MTHLTARRVPQRHTTLPQTHGEDQEPVAQSLLHRPMNVLGVTESLLAIPVQKEKPSVNAGTRWSRQAHHAFL